MDYRTLLVDYGKKLLEERLIAGTSGNLSLRGEDEDTYYITPSGVRYDETRASDIVKIHADGTPYDPAQTPSSEWKMHIAIYKHFPNYKAIVHTHSTAATAFAVARKKIPLILIEMKPFLGGEIPVAPYFPAGSEELATSVLPYLENGNACLMANHGVVCCGETLERAFLAAEYVEDAARIYRDALLVGEPYVLD